MKSNKPSNNGKPDKSGKKLKKDTKFKPGAEWTGNKNGRPKGSISITTRIKQELEKASKKDSTKSYLDILVNRILYKALEEGDKDMIKAIWSYVDGLPRQDITMEVIDKQSAREELESNFEVTPEGEVLKRE